MEDRIRQVLESVARSEVSVDSALSELRRTPALGFIDTAHARVDTHRALRHGLPEVIFGVGKTAAQIADVAATLRAQGQSVLATRVEAEVAGEVQRLLSEGADEAATVVYDAVARLLWIGPEQVPEVGKGGIAVVSAGTADMPVAAEAAGVARRFGNRVEELRDVGVAGIHRLLASEQTLRDARVCIVVAGMEGALPSVVGGLVDKPVIGVPTSVGYGAALGGIAALLGMLTSCSSNVTVVNIDNGFGAAYVATLINRL